MHGTSSAGPTGATARGSSRLQPPSQKAKGEGASQLGRAKADKPRLQGAGKMNSRDPTLKEALCTETETL